MRREHRLLALDPGGTTGWVSFLRCHHGADIWGKWNLTGTGQFGADPPWSGLLFATELLEPGDTVVVESMRFFHRPQQSAHTDLTGLEVIGAVKMLAYLHGWNVVMQEPSQRKGPDKWGLEKSKQVTTFLRGMPHAQDAFRHALVYLLEDLQNGLIEGVEFPSKPM